MLYKYPQTPILVTKAPDVQASELRPCCLEFRARAKP